MSCGFEYCDIKSAIKGVWAADELLNYHIIASEDSDNQFFDEGIVLGEVPLPYVSLSEAPPLDAQSLGPGSNLDIRPYQLKIYGASRLLLGELSAAARSAYLRAGCLSTKEGSICHMKVSAGNHMLFGDGTRMVLHRINASVISRYELSD